MHSIVKRWDIFGTFSTTLNWDCAIIKHLRKLEQHLDEQWDTTWRNQWSGFDNFVCPVFVQEWWTSGSGWPCNFFVKNQKVLRILHSFNLSSTHLHSFLRLIFTHLAAWIMHSIYALLHSILHACTHLIPKRSLESK